MTNARSLEAVHTHTHTHTELTNEKTLVNISYSKFNMLKTVK